MWALFAIAASLSAGINSIFQKETLQKLHAVQLMTITLFATVVFSLFLIPFVNFSLTATSIFWILLTSAINVGAFICTIKAMRHLEVSVVAPFFNIGTAFAAFLGLIFFKEHISWLGVSGIILLITGGYILELKHRNLLQPFRDLVKSKYIHFLLGGVFLFSVKYALDKFVLIEVTPISYFFFQHIVCLVFFTSITLIFYGGVKDIKSGIKHGGWLVPFIGLTAMVEGLTIFQALNMAPVSLVVPLYRTWTFWAVLLGCGFLHEKHLVKRLLASALMILGATFILI